MSTRGEIGFVMNDGSVYSIYNHFDSYLDGLGATLKEELQPGDNVVHFILEWLNQNLDNVYKYANEEEFASSMETSDREYLYLWKDNEWKVVTCHYKDDKGGYVHTFLPFYCEHKHDSPEVWVIMGPNKEVLYSD